MEQKKARRDMRDIEEKKNDEDGRRRGVTGGNASDKTVVRNRTIYQAAQRRKEGQRGNISSEQSDEDR